MDTFLTPIEKPSGFGMKLAYFFTKRQVGKVLMPLKVHSARLPDAFGMFYGKLPALDKKLQLAPEITMLIRVWVSQLNVCLFCIDASRSAVIARSMNEAKFDALNHYSTSPLFTESDRAALDYATELTKDREIAPATFARLLTFFSEREICEIVYLIASEHLYNLTNIGLNIHSDQLCDIRRQQAERV
ncbi:carboxymuconolactone decarboxylase family protein [Spirosoma jeollabukense]